MTTEELENKIGFQIDFLILSGKKPIDALKSLIEITKDYHQANLELSNLQAIQEYLLSRGTNDERINGKIRELTIQKSKS